MPGERVGLGRLEGEGEEWQFGACSSYGWWAPHLALVMDGGPAPHLGLLGGGGQLQLIQHLFELQLVRQLSLGIGRKDKGVGSPTSMGVRLVMLCIANSIRSSLIKVNVQGLTSKVNAGSRTRLRTPGSSQESRV